VARRNRGVAVEPRGGHRLPGRGANLEQVVRRSGRGTEGCLLVPQLRGRSGEQSDRADPRESWRDRRPRPSGLRGRRVDDSVQPGTLLHSGDAAARERLELEKQSRPGEHAGAGRPVAGSLQLRFAKRYRRTPSLRISSGRLPDQRFRRARPTELRPLGSIWVRAWPP
jgi:hypothetical protein